MSTDFAANDGETSSNVGSRDRKERSARRAHHLTGLLIPIAFGAILFGASALAVHFQAESDSRHADTIEGPSTSENVVVQNDVVRPTTNAAEFATLNQIADRLSSVHHEVAFAQVRLSLAEYETARTKFRSELDRIREDEVGLRIAANDDLLVRFVLISTVKGPESETPSRSDIEVIRGDRTSVVDPDFTQAIVELQTRLSQWRAFEQQRLAMLSTLRQAAESFPVGTESLNDAISECEVRLAKTKPEAIEAASVERESQESHLESLMAQVEAEEAKVKGLRDRLSSVQKGQLDNPQPTKQDQTPLASRADYRRELPLIRSTLQAFTTPGYMQPKSATELTYEQSKTPMSYSALLRVGALENDESGSGIRILFFVGGSKTVTQNNDRPLGSFPRMNSVQELEDKLDVAKKVAEAQRLLRTYGPLMVEDDLLSP